MTETTQTRTPTKYPHIELDHKGRPVVAGTRFRVSMIAQHVYSKVEPYTPTQLVESFPHLSLSQVHSALAYYHENQAEIDATIEEEHRFVEEMRKKHEDPERTALIWERAKRLGLIPT